jgi:hypothetical protein
MGDCSKVRGMSTEPPAGTVWATEILTCIDETSVGSADGVNVAEGAARLARADETSVGSADGVNVAEGAAAVQPETMAAATTPGSKTRRILRTRSARRDLMSQFPPAISAADSADRGVAASNPLRCDASIGIRDRQKIDRLAAATCRQLDTHVE